MHSSQSGRRLWAAVVLVLVATLIAAAPAVHAVHEDGKTWITSWATAHVRQDGTSAFTMAAFPLQKVTQQTIRQVIQPAAGGDQLRIRLSNIEGGGPVTFGHITLAKTIGTGPAVVPSTLRQVRFRDSSYLTLYPGAETVSDPIDLDVEAGDHLAVTTYVVAAFGPYSGHSEAKNLSWYSPPLTGDHANDTAGDYMPIPSPSWSWIRSVDVMTTPRPVIVVLGDSISDGYPVPEVRTEWPALLGDRLAQRGVVINNALDANVVTPTGCAQCGPPIVHRFNHDALDLPGVTHVIVLAGSNDITQNVYVGDIERTFEDLTYRAHRRGIQLIVGTLTPRDDVVLGWNPKVHGPMRRELNNWILENDSFDAVVDFDRILRDRLRPDTMKPYYDSGDRSHPGPLGMAAMADAVPLGLFALHE